MRTLIVTEDEALGARLRRALVGAGHDCPQESIVRPGTALAALGQAELVVLDVGRDAGAAASAVGRLRPMVKGRLVAVGELGTARAALQVRRAGADEYVEAADAINELSTVLNGAGTSRIGGRRSGRVLAIVSPSGGGGASTLAVNLAVVLAGEIRQDLALIDLVPVTGCLADLLDLKPVHTLADLCEAPERLDREILERTLVHHDSGVRLLASPRRYEARERVAPETVDRLLELARGRFPFVVVDLDRDLGPAALHAAQSASAVVVAFRQEFTSLRDARLALDHLERHGIPPQRLYPVAMRRGQPREVPAAKVEEALRMKLLGAVPEDPKTVIRAANNGVPLVIEARSSRSARAIRELARLIRARVEACVEVR